MVIDFNKYLKETKTKDFEDAIYAATTVEALIDITQEIEAVLRYMKKAGYEAKRAKHTLSIFYDANYLYVLSSTLKSKGQSLVNIAGLIDGALSEMEETPDPEIYADKINNLWCDYVKETTPIIFNYHQMAIDLLKEEQKHDDKEN